MDRPDRDPVNQILPFLHLGSYKLYEDANAVFFAKQQVDLLINVTKEEEFPTPYKFVAQTPLTVRLSVLDKNTEADKMLDALPGLADLIHCYVSNSKHVLVHCQHGLQRSATIVVAYVRKHRRDLYSGQEVTRQWTKQDYMDKSIEYVRQARPDIFGGSKPGKEYMNFKSALTRFDTELYEAGM